MHLTTGFVVAEKLELDLDVKMDFPEKAAAPPRRRRRFGDLTDDEDDADVEYSTPVERAGVASEMRRTRRSKTMAMSRLTASVAAKCSIDDSDRTESEEGSE